MNRVHLATLGAAVAFAVAALPASAAAPAQFTFGTGKPAAGYTAVTTDMAYSGERGFGFERGTVPNAGKPFFFTVDVPEGNYNVTVTLGDDKLATATTVKAELRRLMLENVATRPGESVKRTFTVNTRTPQIAAAGNIAADVVKLKEPRESVQKAWTWDRKLTLEFNGTQPSVRTIEITPANVPTLFLIGDSTVCDQTGEPYSSWGQMLPRFFKPGVAVSNHAESGETYRDSIGRRRLDKILSMMKPGDTMLMQFGHNDQKQIASGKGSAQTTYKAEIRVHVDGVRGRGGVPVIVSPMERRRFDEQGRAIATLAEYADAAREVAKEMGVAFIDLNAMSKPFYEALGPKKSERAFAEPTPGHIDNTHHNNYGAYQLAKAVITGLREAKVGVASFVADDFGSYDPARPDPVETFAVPPSPVPATERPAGDEANR
jgi:lysophospholipase L1-like esterase